MKMNAVVKAIIGQIHKIADGDLGEEKERGVFISQGLRAWDTTIINP